jgi:hypothetical protein
MKQALRLLAKNSAIFVSKKELARKPLSYATDLHLSQVGCIERGEVSTSISFIYLFAQVLQVHPKDFFD